MCIRSILLSLVTLSCIGNFMTPFANNNPQFTANAVVIDHDEWEFHGGRKKRRTHGLNNLIDVEAEKQSHIVVANDEGVVIDDFAAVIKTSDNDEDGDDDRTNKVRDSRKRRKDDQSKKQSSGIFRGLFRSRSGGGGSADDEIIYALPDRFSVLNFDSTEGDDSMEGDEQGDEEDEESLAQKAWWGRLYIDGFPGPFQYFRAHFGVPPPPPPPATSDDTVSSANLKFILADPPTACDSEEFTPMLLNTDQIDENTIVVIVRGDCTFGEKAIEVHKAGALGVLFINNEDGNQHPSGPEALDLNLTASMIAMDDGLRLVEALNSTTARNKHLGGRFIPIYCGQKKQQTVTSNTGSYCEPVRASDRKFVSDLNYSGTLTSLGIGVLSFDYIQADFGGWFDDDDDEWNLVKAQDDYCCDKESCGGGGMEILEGMAVLVRRGKCDFATKAEVLAEYNAAMMVLANNNSTAFRMGVEPHHRGRKIELVAVMISGTDGEKLEDAILQNIADPPIISLQRNKKHMARIKSGGMDICMFNSSLHDENSTDCTKVE